MDRRRKPHSSISRIDIQFFPPFPEYSRFREKERSVYIAPKHEAVKKSFFCGKETGWGDKYFLRYGLWRVAGREKREREKAQSDVCAFNG